MELDKARAGHGMKDGTLNILIGGEAGQGLVTLGQLLAKSLMRSGYFISF